MNNKIVNPKLVATHHFCEVGVFTKEFESDNGNSCVIIESARIKGAILVKAFLENGKIVTSVSII